MKKIFLSLFPAIILVALVFMPTKTALAQGLRESLSGRILLQTQQGTVWYVNPVDKNRYALGVRDDSLSIIKMLAVGISNNNLKKIQVADFNLASSTDSDNDGLADNIEAVMGTDRVKADTDGDGHSDKAEIMSGYNPLGTGKIPLNKKFAAAKKGRFFLQAEGRGEIWYINPLDNKRYLISNQRDMIDLIKKLGLKISDSQISRIPVGTLASVKCDSSACLSDMARICQSSESTYGVSIPYPASSNQIINESIFTKVARTGNNSCYLTQQLRGGSISMSDINRRSIINASNTEAQLNSQISSINQILKSRAAMDSILTCNGLAADLAAYIAHTATGLIGSDCLAHLGAAKTDCQIAPNLACTLTTPNN